MDTKHLQDIIEHLRQLFDELDGGLPDEKWKVLRRTAKLMVRTVRLVRAAETHRKYRMKFQDADPNLIERDPKPTALETKLFNEMVSVHIAIHRRLKQLRELPNR